MADEKTFVKAAADDELHVVKHLWESKRISNIDVPVAVRGGHSDPWPALFWASGNGHLQIVRYLISQGMLQSIEARRRIVSCVAAQARM
jgi:hypothetical protein